MNEKESIGSWGELYIVCFFLELLWDFGLVHVVAMFLITKKGYIEGGEKWRERFPAMFFKNVPPQGLPAPAPKAPKDPKAEAKKVADKKAKDLAAK
jgi:hypothetical protein